MLQQAAGTLACHRWDTVLAAPSRAGHPVIDTDMLAILYSSGSAGKPMGVVLHNYLLARDLLKALEREKVNGLTAVPPLYIQLSQLE